ncbi:MAG: amino-acid N-acetyltransferase [Pseudomonadota bacterium]
MSDQDWLYWFRHSAPYINAHRGRVVVITLGGDALAHPNLTTIIHDIALLASLGVRLVVAFGARPQIRERLDEAGETSGYQGRLRVTTETQLPLVLEAVGRVRALLESHLSMGVANSPMHGAQIRVASGNWVTARPIGVIEGVDHGYTGRVRRVDAASIREQLSLGQVVLLPPLGYSATGDAFNLSHEEVAGEAAAALEADKLIVFSDRSGIPDAGGELIREVSVARARELLSEGHLGEDDAAALEAAANACDRNVRRAHIISYGREGALLEELFTLDGLGTLVTDDDYEHIRFATPEDINGIQELIQPLEAKGILVSRPRDLIETEVDRFLVDERDGRVVGCAALYPYPSSAMMELACFAVNPDYQGGGRGDRMLAMVERHARAEGLGELFVLTTQTSHWFAERGFEPVGADALPPEKRRDYDTDRNSRIFVKQL